MLHLLDGPKHLRANIFAAYNTLQVTPCANAGFLFKPSLERFGERVAI
jgi:hypothetical protein